MRISNKNFALSLGLVVPFLAGCEKDPQDPDDYIAFCEEYAEIVESQSEDCDQMGSDLESFFKHNESFLREASKIDKDNEEFEVAGDACRERLGSVGRVIDDTCRDNENVNQALAFYANLTSP
jgi:hypothetical protein